MSFRVTVIVENTAGRGGVLGEHGLSYLIEDGQRRVLFDTGQGRALAPNVEVLGLDVRVLDAIVLSHGHYDHVGGLVWVLRQLEYPPPVFLHPAALEPHWSRSPGPPHRSIGMASEIRFELEASGAPLMHTTRPTEIVPGIWATGPVPRETDFEDVGGPFFLDESCTVPDPIEDDQALWLATGEGTVVLLGCAHAGVINTLEYVRKHTGDAPIRAVAGGMHLVHADKRRLEKTAEAFAALNLKMMAPCHCTSPRGQAFLRNRFEDSYVDCMAGTVFEF